MDTSSHQDPNKVPNLIENLNLNQQTISPITSVTATTVSTGTITSTITTSNAACATAATTTSPNVVTIPVPIVPPEDIYTYVAIKGSLHAQDCSIFGLNREEIIALSKRFPSGSTEIMNGIMIKASPIEVINTISKLGYKVICTSGEAEIVWTMQREI